MVKLHHPPHSDSGGLGIESEPQGAPPPFELMDVWTRTQRKYRLRAALLLAINVLLFAGVGSFAFWLRSGERFAPATEGYRDQLAAAFIGVGRAEVSLGSLLIEPISVQDVPMQIPIVGLLMAALIAIPILVAMLYRFWSSLPFIAVIGFLAVMPWLAITLLGSCVLASVRPFRTRFRFVSSLVGLVPAVVYLVLAWSGTGEAVRGGFDPVDGIKFIAPWVLAIVAAALVFAIVLLIARIVGYRPGAITPLLALMLALPVVLFEFHVGRDELHYRLLEALNEAHFTEVDASVAWDQAARQAWARHPLPRPSWRAIREIEEEKWLFELSEDMGPYQSDLTKHQIEVAQRCDRFRRLFPDSRYARNVLCIRARAMDMRVDSEAFRRDKWIRFYDDFPSVASKETWRMLLDIRPDSLLGALAGLRLAQIDARDGHVGRAVDRLNSSMETLELGLQVDADATNHSSRPGGVLARGDPETELDISRERLLLEVHRLRDLLVFNRDPVYGFEPLCGSHTHGGGWSPGLMDFDPRHARYVANLRGLISRYPNAQIEDDLELEIAKSVASLPEKTKRLESCLDRFPNRNSAAEALLRLGVAYREGGDPLRSDNAFRKLVGRFPKSVWARQARRYTTDVGPDRLTRAAP